MGTPVPSRPPRPALADRVSTTGRPHSADKKGVGQHRRQAAGVTTQGLCHSSGSVTEARGLTGWRFKHGDVYSRRRGPVKSANSLL